jgi:HAD superfamily hydrolase (TIGR01549 family)
MQMISHVLFDLDDTLCDFSGARDRGLAEAFSILAPEHREEAVRRWHEVDPVVFGHFSRRNISRDGYRRLRFTTTLSILGDTRALFGTRMPVTEADIDRAVDEMNRAFMTEVNEKIRAVDGAPECLSALRKEGIKCHILTNGPLDGQLKKLKITGLDQLVEEVFVSEALGASKPDPEVYRIVLAQLGVGPATAAMVGDSLENDVLPARSLGMRSLLYAPSTPEEDSLSVRTLWEVPHAIAALQQHQGS